MSDEPRVYDDSPEGRAIRVRARWREQFGGAPVQRFKLTVAYRGTAYHGWQHQDVPPTWKGPTKPNAGLPTVQETLRDALVFTLRHPLTCVGSSRTDGGVHAKGQVVHVDSIRTTIPEEGLRRALNERLPDDVIVRKIERVGPEFDAISSTVRKRYQYAIWNAPERSVFAGDLYFYRRKPLSLDAMRTAAAPLVGTHDFASFARPGHKRENTVRTVHAVDVARRGPLVVIGVEGAGFLWNQVRIMAGALVQAGLGELDPGTFAAMLEARDRRAAGNTAPAHGLYLQWIRFEGDAGLSPA